MSITQSCMVLGVSLVGAALSMVVAPAAKTNGDLLELFIRFLIVFFGCVAQRLTFRPVWNQYCRFRQSRPRQLMWHDELRSMTTGWLRQMAYDAIEDLAESQSRLASLDGPQSAVARHPPARSEEIPRGSRA